MKIKQTIHIKNTQNQYQTIACFLAWIIIITYHLGILQADTAGPAYLIITMGIQGLLKVMKPYINPVHIQKFAGQRVGIDAYSWLHKGAYSCSMEICQQTLNNNDPNIPYLQYCMHRINMLKYYKVIPVVVFDGGRLPLKALTEDERQRRRTVNLEQAQSKLKEGDIRGAVEFFQRAVEITPFMANQLIQILKAEAVEYIVAPYEADAQLAYLSSIDQKQGGIGAVITEDSDLMAYGCNVVIYKMDRNGDGEEVNMDKVFKGTIVSNGSLSFRNFTKELFTGMCVLAGCDFLSSIYGIGIKKAHALVSKYRNLDRALSVLKLDKKHSIPEGYVNSFKEACALFHHARIYDIKLKCFTFLTPLPEELSKEFDNNLDFLGPDLPSSMAIAIAEGKLDPITMEAFSECEQVYSLQKRKISTKDSMALPYESREIQTVKESSPFIFLSENIKDDNFLLTEEVTHRDTKDDEFLLTEEITYRDSMDTSINKAKDNIQNSKSSRQYEDNRFTPASSQRSSCLDSSLVRHFRSIVEESSKKAFSEESKLVAGNKEEDSEVCTIEVRGQKRVFPPTPCNNPFKKMKLDASTSPHDSESVFSNNKNTSPTSTLEKDVEHIDSSKLVSKHASVESDNPILKDSTNSQNLSRPGICSAFLSTPRALGTSKISSSSGISSVSTCNDASNTKTPDKKDLTKDQKKVPRNKGILRFFNKC